MDQAMSHLTAERLQRLLDDPKNDPELFEHLAGGCEVCEAFLAATHDALLDGATDAALLSLASATAAPADIGERRTWSRVRRALVPSRLRWLGALAAALLVVLGVALLRPRDRDAGLKGAGLVTLELEAALQRGDGTLSRIETGAQVPPDAVLLLRYRASEATPACVVLQRSTSREVLGPVQLEAGTHDLPQGVSLAGEQGPVTVTLAACATREALEAELDSGGVRGASLQLTVTR